MVPARPSVPVLRQIAEGSLSKGDWLGSGGLRGKLWDFISYKSGCSDLLILKEHLAALPYSPPRGRSIQKGQARVENFLKLGKPISGAATTSRTKSHSPELLNPIKKPCLLQKPSYCCSQPLHVEVPFPCCAPFGIGFPIPKGIVPTYSSTLGMASCLGSPNGLWHCRTSQPQGCSRRHCIQHKVHQEICSRETPLEPGVGQKNGREQAH